MQLTLWNNLNDEQKKQIRAAYIYWNLDTTVTTFEEWADKHAFYITSAGNLSMRHKHCEPSYMAEA